MKEQTSDKPVNTQVSMSQKAGTQDQLEKQTRTLPERSYAFKRNSSIQTATIQAAEAENSRGEALQPQVYIRSSNLAQLNGQAPQESQQSHSFARYQGPLTMSTSRQEQIGKVPQSSCNLAGNQIEDLRNLNYGYERASRNKKIGVPATRSHNQQVNTLNDASNTWIQAQKGSQGVIKTRSKAYEEQAARFRPFTEQTNNQSPSDLTRFNPMRRHTLHTPKQITPDQRDKIKAQVGASPATGPNGLSANQEATAADRSHAQSSTGSQQFPYPCSFNWNNTASQAKTGGSKILQGEQALFNSDRNAIRQSSQNLNGASEGKRSYLSERRFHLQHLPTVGQANRQPWSPTGMPTHFAVPNDTPTFAQPHESASSGDSAKIRKQMPRQSLSKFMQPQDMPATRSAEDNSPPIYSSSSHIKSGESRNNSYIHAAMQQQNREESAKHRTKKVESPEDAENDRVSNSPVIFTAPETLKLQQKQASQGANTGGACTAYDPSESDLILGVPKASVHSCDNNTFQEQKVVITAPCIVQNSGHQQPVVETLPVSPESSVVNDEDTARQLDTLMKPDWRSTIHPRRQSQQHIRTEVRVPAHYVQQMVVQPPSVQGQSCTFHQFSPPIGGMFSEQHGQVKVAPAAPVLVKPKRAPVSNQQQVQDVFPKFERQTDYKARSARYLDQLGELVQDVSSHSDDYLTMLEMYLRGSAALTEQGLNSSDSRATSIKPMELKGLSGLRGSNPEEECDGNVTSIFLRKRDSKVEAKKSSLFGLPNRNLLGIVEQMRKGQMTMFGGSESSQQRTGFYQRSRRPSQQLSHHSSFTPNSSSCEVPMPGPPEISAEGTHDALNAAAAPIKSDMKVVEHNVDYRSLHLQRANTISTISTKPIESLVQATLKPTENSPPVPLRENVSAISGEHDQTDPIMYNQLVRQQHSEERLGTPNHIEQSLSEKDNMNSSSTPGHDDGQHQYSNRRSSHQKRQHRTIRRIASEISKDFKCFHCEKRYGSEAAAVMHMRKKHKEGTKQDMERDKGIRVRDVLLDAQQSGNEVNGSFLEELASMLPSEKGQQQTTPPV